MTDLRLKFLTIKEAADFLRVSIRTVERWRLLGRIRVHKAGRRVLVVEDQLLQDLGIDPLVAKTGLADGGSLGLNLGARGRS